MANLGVEEAPKRANTIENRATNYLRLFGSTTMTTGKEIENLKNRFGFLRTLNA
jgi:hypothetical protein